MEETQKKMVMDHAREMFQKVKNYQNLGLVCKDGDFVPSVHYPPITQYPPVNQNEYLSTFVPLEGGKMDVYVHIPFCIRHCLFCHYPGMTGERTAEKEKYISYLIREMDLYLKRFSLDRIKPRSILLGGGTPAFLPPSLLGYFLTEFEKRLDMRFCRQYNIDLDPNSILGDDGTRRCELMKQHGITRLTIGVQSFDDGVLHMMNRAHTAREAEEAIRKAADFGFDINIEFIYGHPGETIDNWIEVMERAVQMPVGEIQIYRLKVQAYGDYQGAINRHARGQGQTDIPDFETTMLMKQIAIDILAGHGYHETLRRVYGKTKKVYSHYAYNQCCNQFDQVGFGLTGFSSYRDRFDINTNSFEEYYSLIDQGLLPINRGYIRPLEEQVRWAIVLPLKNRDVRKREFFQRTGLQFDDLNQAKISLLKEHGLLEDTGEIIRLTETGGFLADEVCEQFNSPKFIPFPRERYADGPLNPYYKNELMPEIKQGRR